MPATHPGRLVLPLMFVLCLSCQPGKSDAALQDFNISLNGQGLGDQFRWFKEKNELIAIGSIGDLDLVCRFGDPESKELKEIMIYNAGKEELEIRDLSLHGGSVSITPSSFPEDVLWLWEVEEDTRGAWSLVLDLSTSSAVLLPGENLQIFRRE